MDIIRVYADSVGQSHFEDLIIPQRAGPMNGLMSKYIGSEGVSYWTLPEGAWHDFQPSDRRRFIVTLSGVVETGVGDGSVRRRGPGEIFLSDDSWGTGHYSRIIVGPWEALFLLVHDDVDVTPWRTL